MYTMSQINHIKDLSNCGYRISEISKKLVPILKQSASIFHRRTSLRYRRLSRQSHLSWIHLSQLSRSGLMRIKSTGENSITLHSGYMNAWLKSRDIQAAPPYLHHRQIKV